MVRLYCWSADFETTTDEKDCRVWGWAVCEIGNSENLYMGTTIDSFMMWVEDLPDNDRIYFHNLKFDSQFIIAWLFEENFKCVNSSRERATRTFRPIISDKGLYYSLEVVFFKHGKRIKKVTFWDSLKLIPLSVEGIAEALRLPIKKGKIDYDAHNLKPYGSELTEEEKEYIKNDVIIVAKAIELFQKEGLDKMTIGSCALNEYIKSVGKANFNRWFPTSKNYYDDLKQSYKGGFTYLNPKFSGKKVGNGIVLDVNGLYSHVMKEKILPYGTPIFFKGKYVKDDLYPLYTQMIRCQFELKKGKIPTIQIKNYSFFSGNEYLDSSNDEEVVICLNSVDLELFLENYDVYNLEYMSGWKFKGTIGLFDDYIDKWSNKKIESKKEENWGLYLISKLFLNSLYGKFGTSIRRKSKIPYMDVDGVIKYKDSDYEESDGLYIPIASFVTSYARDITIRAAQKITDDYNEGKSNIEFVYADTDSLHCLSCDFSLPEGFEINQTKLGAWKFESKFTNGKYLRQKCYIEQSTEDVENENPEYKLKITVAGMPKECYEKVNFQNFKLGAVYKGKKQPKRVPGGIILESVDFTIKK